MEKVAVYASFKKQSRKSIDFFLRKIADWCLVNNYDYTIYFDKVQERTNLKNRKELENLKEHIRQKRYSKVIVKNITQLSTNTDENIDFINFLLYKGNIFLTIYSLNSLFISIKTTFKFIIQ